MSSTSTAAQASLRLLAGFDDPAWDRLTAPSVFLTRPWQQAWWESFGRDRKLLLVLAEEEGKPVALAPLFTDSGMINPVASGGSDYLDFPGDVSDGRLAAMLRFASEQVPDFQGCVFYHVPDASPTAVHLKATAEQLGWLRFTRVDLNGKPVAFHLGFCYRGEYMWYKPTFNVELARSSPGEVLLRQLLLAALEEGANVFDFGLGDEAFKARFATQVNSVRNWGLYPPHVLARGKETA